MSLDLLPNLEKIKKLEQVLKEQGSVHELKWIVEAYKQGKNLVSIEELIDRRSKGEPLAYLLGEWPFCGLNLKIHRGVLIPRPETEELAYLCFERLKAYESPLKIVDCGAGTGALGLGLASLLHIHNPERSIEVVLLEKEGKALSCLKENSQLVKKTNNVKVEFFEHDWNTASFENVGLLISNPPYVSRSEFKKLDLGVSSFEPITALVDESEDTLQNYRELLHLADSCLQKGASLAFEIGPAQVEFFKSCSEPCFKNFDSFELKQDMAQKPRFFWARKRI